MNDEERAEEIQRLIKNVDLGSLDENKKKLVKLVPILSCKIPDCPEGLHRFLLHIDTLEGTPIGVSLGVEDCETSETEEIVLLIPDVLELMEAVGNMIRLQLLRLALSRLDFDDDAPEDLLLS